MPAEGGPSVEELAAQFAAELRDGNPPTPTAPPPESSREGRRRPLRAADHAPPPPPGRNGAATGAAQPGATAARLLQEVLDSQEQLARRLDDVADAVQRLHRVPAALVERLGDLAGGVGTVAGAVDRLAARADDAEAHHAELAATLDRLVAQLHGGQPGRAPAGSNGPPPTDDGAKVLDGLVRRLRPPAPDVRGELAALRGELQATSDAVRDALASVATAQAAVLDRLARLEERAAGAAVPALRAGAQEQPDAQTAVAAAIVDRLNRVATAAQVTAAVRLLEAQLAELRLRLDAGPTRDDLAEVLAALDPPRPA